MATVTLVVGTGSGEADANSNATADEFAQYMWRIPAAYKTVFTDADTYQREEVLVWATQLLKANIVWPSGTYRKYQTQALDFPRLNVVDQDGFLVGEASVPPFLKDATCQMAFELLKNDLTTQPPRGLSGISVGPISLDFDVNHPANVQPIIPRSVLTLIAPYGGVLRGQARLRSSPLYRA